MKKDTMKYICIISNLILLITLSSCREKVVEYDEYNKLTYAGLSFDLNKERSITMEYPEDSMHYISLDEGKKEHLRIWFSEGCRLSEKFLNYYLSGFSADFELQSDSITSGTFGEYNCLKVNYSIKYNDTDRYGMACIINHDSSGKGVFIIKLTPDKERLPLIFNEVENSFKIDRHTTNSISYDGISFGFADDAWIGSAESDDPVPAINLNGRNGDFFLLQIIPFEASDIKDVLIGQLNAQKENYYGELNIGEFKKSKFSKYETMEVDLWKFFEDERLYFRFLTFNIAGRNIVVTKYTFEEKDLSFAFKEIENSFVVK